MAAKRTAFDSVNEQIIEKKMKPCTSFASGIKEVMMVKSFNSFCSALEPLLRRVVNEEVERGLEKRIKTLTKSSSFRIQAPEPSTLKLIFANKSLPTTFTCNKVLDINDQPLQLYIVEERGDQIMTPKALTSPIKIELVIVDGDFPGIEREMWTVEEFSRKVVKERDGRRPLVTKDVSYVIRDNMNWVNIGDIELTDNSSWIRSRKFRLGARVVGGTTVDGVRVLEALTEPFVVKDHRGELYKKHYPPMLEDEVWRLEKIGKGGTYHKRLAQHGINNVQDLLKLFEIDRSKLKKILGGKNGISENSWEGIMRHAKKCNLGNKLYISNGSKYTLILDPICRISGIIYEGQILSSISDLSMASKKEVEQLVNKAYENWVSLREVDKSSHEIFPAPLGNNTVEECNNEQTGSLPYDVVIGEYIEVGFPQHAANNDVAINIGEWDTSLHNLM